MAVDYDSKKYLESVDAYVLECNNIEECEAAIERFNHCNNVSYAEMNYIRSEWYLN